MSGSLQGTFVGLTGTGQTKCANVTFNPPDQTTAPGPVLMSTTTVGAHIFYTKTPTTGVPPTHNADNATGTTIRISNNSGSDPFVGTINHTVVLEALAYKAGLLDSDITIANYPPQGSNGRGGGQ